MNLSNSTYPSALTFHLRVPVQGEILYYVAVADPKDEKLVLDYQRRDYGTLDSRVKTSFDEKFPNQENGGCVITFDHHLLGTDIKKRLRQVATIFITCEVPASEDYLKVAETIKSCCQKAFANMRAETSFLKMRRQEGDFGQTFGYIDQNDNEEFKKVWVETDLVEIPKASIRP